MNGKSNAMTYCTECECVEGKVYWDKDDVIICGECDGEDCIENVKEHDDSDMER